MEVYILYCENYCEGEFGCSVLSVTYSSETIIKKLDLFLKNDINDDFVYRDEDYKKFVNYIKGIEEGNLYSCCLNVYHNEVENYDDYSTYYIKKLNIEF